MQFTGSKPPGGGFAYEAALQACAAGDRRALQTLYDHEAARMLGVAMRLLRRQSLAEDAVHDTFVQIWNKAQTFDPALGAGRSWMYAILRNRALNMLRAEDRLDFVEDLEHPAAAVEHENPEAVLSKLSDASALKRCLEQLEPNRRAAILQAYLRGLTHAEIAGSLGAPVGTVKSWIRRGLLSLRECLG
jgi:RNA polymerase sigma-70 factor (ECF subfamily)